MKYTKFTFIKPPRPEIAIHPSRLGFYDHKGWIAQAKLNGTYNEFAVTPKHEFISRRRTGEAHLQWSFTPASKKAFLSLPSTWYVFCAELLNNKVEGIRDTNVLHDILVANGNLLTGLTYLERHKILRELFPSAKRTKIGYSIINDNTWIADTFQNRFSQHYERQIQLPECEGLVLKNTINGFSLGHPCRGMIKCRKPTKSYGF